MEISNALAYYADASISGKKGFVTSGAGREVQEVPGDEDGARKLGQAGLNVIKRFLSVIYYFS